MYQKQVRELTPGAIVQSPEDAKRIAYVARAAIGDEPAIVATMLGEPYYVFGDVSINVYVEAGELVRRLMGKSVLLFTIREIEQEALHD